MGYVVSYTGKDCQCNALIPEMVPPSMRSETEANKVGFLGVG